MRRDNSEKMTSEEKRSLMEVIAAEAKTIRKERACNADFQAYIEVDN